MSVSKFAIESLESLINHYRGNLNYKIYAERLLALAVDQAKLFNSHNIRRRQSRINSMRASKGFSQINNDEHASLNINKRELEYIHSQMTSK